MYVPNHGQSRWKKSNARQVSYAIAAPSRLGKTLIRLIENSTGRRDRNGAVIPVKIAIGAPILSATIARFSGDAQSMMDFLRTETYRLSPRAVDQMPPWI